ncbi:MAG: hypothetical protein ACQER9_02085 [Nanobdellota archaeon]
MNFYFMCGKKGFMFSFIAILFFIILMTFSLYLVEQKEDSEILGNEFFLENKRQYYAEDIGFSVCNVTKFVYAGSDYGSGNVTFNFDYLWEEGNFSSLESDFLSYESFVEGKYSNVTNSDFNVLGNVFGFIIPDYSIVGNFSSSNVSLVFGNPSDVKSFDVDIYVDESSMDSFDSPSDNGDLLVDIDFYDSSDVLIKSFSKNLDVDVSNDDFFVNFSSGASVSVNFGDDSVVVSSSSLVASLRNVSIKHKAYWNETRLFSGASVEIFGIRKSLPID